MAVYKPDKWVVIKYDSKEGNKPYYKVLGSWSGSYLHGYSWKLNSGITKVTKHLNYYHFEGFSGSTYVCHEEMYGLSMITANIITLMIDQNPHMLISRMPADTDWLSLDYSDE